MIEIEGKNLNKLIKKLDTIDFADWKHVDDWSEVEHYYGTKIKGYEIRLNYCHVCNDTDGRSIKSFRLEQYKKGKLLAASDWDWYELKEFYLKIKEGVNNLERKQSKSTLQDLLEDD